MAYISLQKQLACHHLLFLVNTVPTLLCQVNLQVVIDNKALFVPATLRCHNLLLHRIYNLSPGLTAGRLGPAYVQLSA